MRNMLKKPLAVTVLIAASLFVCAAAFSQERAQKSVTAVDVRNNKNVSNLTILAKVKTKAGQPFSQSILNEDIKRLYATGYFVDVSVDLSDYNNGVKVVFFVKEKPVLDKIEVIGNKLVKTDAIRKAMKSKEDEALDRKVLKEDIDEVQKLYEKKGFSLVKITYNVQLDDKTNEAKVVVRVDEGKRLRIKKINVEGNIAFSDKKIKKIMKTKTRGLFRAGYLKEEELEEDVDRIKAFYQTRGYIDVMVDKQLDYDEYKKQIYLTIKVNEGKKYTMGAAIIKGNAIFPEKEIRARLKMTPGRVFSPDAMKDDMASIQTYYYERGYIFCDITPETALDPATGKVNVTYDIVENDIAYLSKVIIQGNTKTKDFVVRRELRVSPGERFDGRKLQRSKERLYNLGYFEEVAFDTKDTNIPDKKDLVVTVKEAKTGEFSFGGGFSSVDRLVGFVAVEQRNFDLFNWPTFTGAGQDLKLRTQIGSSMREFELSFTEPWIFGRPVAFGFDVFHTKRLKSKFSGYGYDQQNTGFDLRLGKELGEYLKGSLMYKLERVDISKIPDTAAQDLRDEGGRTVTSSMTGTMSRDTRDNIHVPTKGNMTLFTGELAGGPFLADRDFWKLYGDTDWYFNVFEKIVFEARMRAGIADQYGKTNKMPIFERFYVGGSDTVRGYEERRIGPKDTATNIAVGGKSMLVLNAECTFPVVQYIKGAVFVDAGNIWPEIEDMCSDTLRIGAGLGVRVKTPIGPVKLDYGYPLNQEAGEKKTGRFHFSMTRGF
ncbi:MAG: outer membrane protein assembly factor BamA [Candidatus Omnitrophota bacterium]